MSRLVEAIEKRREADKKDCGNAPCDKEKKFCRTVLLLSPAAIKKINAAAAQAFEEGEIEAHKDAKGHMHYRTKVAFDGITIGSKCDCRE